MTMVESRIEAVKLYVAGATVQRVFTIAPTGDRLPRRIEVPGLPLALDDSTVRVRLRTPVPGARVVFGEVQVGLYAAPREARLDSPDEEALKTLDRRIARREAMMARLDAETSLLTRIAVPARPQGEPGRQPPPSPLAARAALESFVDDSLTERASAISALRTELGRLREAATDLRDKLQRASLASRVSTREVTKTVTASVRHDGDAVVALEAVVEYFVPGARWFPQYQIHIDPRSEHAALTMRALVCQSSGEDWSGVRVKLSTATPMVFSELPKLAAIRIGKSQPPPASGFGFRPPPVGYAALFEDYDRDRARASRAVPAPRSIAEPAHDLQPPPAPLAATARLAEPHNFGGGGYGESVMLGAASSEGWAGPAAAASMPSPSPASRAAAAPPPPPGGMSLPQRKRAAAKQLDKGGALDAEVEEDDGDAFEGLAQVDFAALRLAGPTDSALRSRLQTVSARARYVETLARSGLTLPGAELDAITTAGARSALPAAAPAGAVDFREVVGAFAYAWETTDRVEVPSDAVYHSIPVQRLTADCDLQYVVVPREDRSVYRTARITNPDRAPLLPGPIEVYVNNAYVLTSHLPLVSPRERFQLGLGVEQRIKCARNTRYAETRSGQAVVATSELHHILDIELVNHLERSIQCEVRERLPVPAKDAEVVVEDTAVEPPWEVYTQEDRGRPLLGGRRWRVTLPAGASKTLTAEYVVKIYANNEVVGGNRREA